METTIFRYLLQEKCKEKNAEGKSPLVLDVGGNIGFGFLCSRAQLRSNVFYNYIS